MGEEKRGFETYGQWEWAGRKPAHREGGRGAAGRSVTPQSGVTSDERSAPGSTPGEPKHGTGSHADDPKSTCWPRPPWKAGRYKPSRKPDDGGTSVALEGRQKVAPGKRMRSRGIAVVPTPFCALEGRKIGPWFTALRRA